MSKDKEQEVYGRVKEIIESRGMTQKRVAELMEVSPATLNRMLSGKGSMLLSSLYRLSEVLDVPPSAFLGDDSKEASMLMRLFRMLSESQRSAVLQILVGLARSTKTKMVEDVNITVETEHGPARVRVIDLDEELFLLQCEKSLLTERGINS